MKYVITEEQYSKLPESQKALYWLKRRYSLVLDALKETFELMEFDICRIGNFRKFENKFFTVFMDCLHPHFYENENIDHGTYDAMFNIIKDLFHDEFSDFYFNGRKDC